MLIDQTSRPSKHGRKRHNFIIRRHAHTSKEQSRRRSLVFQRTHCRTSYKPDLGGNSRIVGSKYT
jgi:hypothetical protein